MLQSIRQLQELHSISDIIPFYANKDMVYKLCFPSVQSCA